MPLASPKYPFARQYIEASPEDPGIYALFDNREIVFLGVARGRATIRSQLLAHLSGQLEPGHATHYGWEIRANPAVRYRELLDELKSAARWPRFNSEENGQRDA